MNPVETLRSEHRTIGVALDILEAICRRVEQTRTLDNPEHMDALVDFFLNFADKGHHGKEEALFYPFLEEVRTRDEGGRFWRMYREHELCRHFLRGMRRALGQCKENDPEGPGMLVYTCLGYIEAMRRNIRNETAILLDMEGKGLPETDMAQLASSFAAIEKDWFGTEKYAGYWAVPVRLGRHYIH